MHFRVGGSKVVGEQTERERVLEKGSGRKGEGEFGGPGACIGSALAAAWSCIVVPMQDQGAADAGPVAQEAALRE